MPLAPLGNAQQFFTLCRALPKNADCLSAPIGNAHYKGGKKPAGFHLIGRTMPIHFALLHGAETEIDKIKDNGKIERETNLDRRGPKQIGTV
jgi:hypothetical protein